jgi:hypothetical protein
MNVLLSIIKMLPLLIQLVQTLEETVVQPGAGQAKLAIALEVLTAAYDESGGISKDMPKEKWLTLATNLISKIVGVFNLYKIFKKSAAPA